MKSHAAIALLGMIALTNAYAPPRKLPAAPVPKNYAATVVDTYVEEEPIIQEEKVYKAPVRHVERQPIRVAYDEEKVHSRAGYESAALKRERDDELQQDYARNAQYSFASAVDDGIMDQSHIRQETRDGLKVTGSYAYSDGFFKRTVNYEADENGYRVVAETVEPISETGPVVDLNGRAEVHTHIGGIQTQYSVTGDELEGHRQRIAVLKKSQDAY